MPLLIKVAQDTFKEVEKRLRYKFGHKERERSNHATYLADQARGTVRGCPLHHQRIAISGPPYDEIRTFTCLECKAVACEPEIRDMGFEFETIPDWEIANIFDADLQRQASGNPTLFAVNKSGKRA